MLNCKVVYLFVDTIPCGTIKREEYRNEPSLRMTLLSTSIQTCNNT